MIRVRLPGHLRTLARIESDELRLDAGGSPTISSLLDALEAAYPVLRGTIRDHGGTRRRPMIRFYAGEVDLSNDPADAPLPDAVAGGGAVLRIVGAISGG